MIANHVVMVRPFQFGFNAETAASNSFQNKVENLDQNTIQDQALQEFDNMVSILKANGIEVSVLEDNGTPLTPDSIFPNNWFSTFNSELMLYPMAAKNRRDERKTHFVNSLKNITGYPVNEKLLDSELDRKYLEGTGSLVLDHQSKIAYAALSPRTHLEVLKKWEEISGYKIVAFQSYGPTGELIYHTNVMMTMADQFVVVGLDTIEDSDKQKVKEHFLESNKELILLSNSQIHEHFAGNMLQLKNDSGSKFLLMSETAFNSLEQSQIEQIEKYNNTLVPVPITLIEKIGGGSVRCMLAEIFKS